MTRHRPSAPSALPFHNPTAPPKSHRWVSTVTHDWTVGGAPVVNTGAEQAAVHSEAVGRMVPARFGLAQFAQEHNRKEGRSDHHSRDLSNLLLLSQRLVTVLPCTKQGFLEWCTMESKPLIQSCRNAAVLANKVLQQNPGLWTTENSTCRFNRLKTICPPHGFLHTSVL